MREVPEVTSASCATDDPADLHRRSWQRSDMEAGTDHTRERVPVLMTGAVTPGEMGLIGFADVGESVAAHLGLAPGASREERAMTDFRALPKVELHLHLEGAAPPEFIRTLAAEQGADLSGVFNGDGSYQWTDFAHFLRTYDRASSVLKGPEEFRRLVEAVLEKSAGDGVVYTELFIAPDISGGGDPGSWREHLAAMIEGAEAARGAWDRGAVRLHLHPQPRAPSGRGRRRR